MKFVLLPKIASQWPLRIESKEVRIQPKTTLNTRKACPLAFRVFRVFRGLKANPQSDSTHEPHREFFRSSYPRRTALRRIVGRCAFRNRLANLQFARCSRGQQSTQADRDRTSRRERLPRRAFRGFQGSSACARSRLHRAGCRADQGSRVHRLARHHHGRDDRCRSDLSGPTSKRWQMVLCRFYLGGNPEAHPTRTDP